jgi:peptidoglycan hydrolase-like protein with peptidoglycan-binding domain
MFEGELAPDGTMEIELPLNTSQVTVELFCGEADEPFATYEYSVGHLDPTTETTGVQSRLANLGYYDGEIDGDVGPLTTAAIVRFRREYGLPLSDEVDDVLRDALKWIHDDDDDTDDCEPDHIVTDSSQGGDDASGDAKLDGADQTAGEEDDPGADAGDAADDSVDVESNDDGFGDLSEWDDWDEDSGDNSESGDDDDDGSEDVAEGTT